MLCLFHSEKLTFSIILPWRAHEAGKNLKAHETDQGSSEILTFTACSTSSSNPA